MALTYPRGLTFEQVWAAIMELRESQKETERVIKESQRETALQIKETDRQMKETDLQMKETALQMKETDRQMKETDRQMKETDKRLDERTKALDTQLENLGKQLGSLGNRFGEMLEHMVQPNLVKKFAQMGFTFTKANRTKITDHENNIFTEVDALLENGDKAVAVEIKTKPSIDDIDDHIKRMQKLRRHADLHDDKRIYLGGIAGAVFNDGEKNYALKNGFFVIEPSGDTFNITAPEGDYHIREW